MYIYAQFYDNYCNKYVLCNIHYISIKNSIFTMCLSLNYTIVKNHQVLIFDVRDTRGYTFYTYFNGFISFSSILIYLDIN